MAVKSGPGCEGGGGGSGWFGVVGKFRVGFFVFEAFRHDFEVVFVHVDTPDADGVVSGTGGEKLDVGREEETSEVGFVGVEDADGFEDGFISLLVDAPYVYVALT